MPTLNEHSEVGRIFLRREGRELVLSDDARPYLPDVRLPYDLMREMLKNDSPGVEHRHQGGRKTADVRPLARPIEATGEGGILRRVTDSPDAGIAIGFRTGSRFHAEAHFVTKADFEEAFDRLPEG
ncbi:hypothetical protein EON81_13740 [bacterium]|nr:MAG: hypothetical protein EON81_13740 [bacterium]